MPQTQLPPWRSVLAVVAHPDDESFALGALLAAFAEAGANVSVLCLTRGAASTLHNVVLLSYPDGRLPEEDLDKLAADVVTTAQEVDADGLLGFDLTGVTGHPDHAHATAAALRAAQTLDLPVLGWTVPDAVAARLREEHGAPFDGHAASEIDLVVPVVRALQLEAVACHPSQAVPGSVMWRRIELLGDHEHLRWLRRKHAEER